MKKRLLSLFLALVMTCSLLPAEVLAAETEIQVDDNVIDITDAVVYELTSNYYAKAVNIQITGATVESATEDGTTVNIVLDSNTASDAKIAVTFGTALGKKCDMVGHTAEITLEDSNASVGMTLKGRYNSSDYMSGTKAYTLNFSVAEKITAPPTRLVESDTESTYAGVAIDLNLKDYFENATVFYLVEGEKKTPVDGKTYTFRTLEGGTHTLVFAASNDIGMCEEVVTVTVEVTEIESGAWLGITTSNGIVNYVLFTDKDGNPIDGLIASYGGTNIAVTLPRDYGVNSKITATFNLTQNGDGLPKLSTSNAFNGSNDTKVYNTTLSNGMGKATMYLYNAHPKATNNSYTTYTINYAIDNKAPTLAEGQTDTGVAEVVAGNAYTIDLGPIFADTEGDDLTYSVKINGEAAVVADKNYSFVPELGGTYELEFFAKDFMSTSVESYKVTLTVTNSTETYEMKVLIPENITPKFYVTDGYNENGVDIFSDEIVYEEGDLESGYKELTVKVPANVSLISVRDQYGRGMAFEAGNGGQAVLREVNTNAKDLLENEIEYTAKVVYDGHTAAGKDNTFLLVSGKEYTFTATPKDTSNYVATSKASKIGEGTDVALVEISVNYNNPKTITVPTGAKAQLYNYNKYYDFTEYPAKVVINNEDGTSTYYFIAGGSNMSWRVSMDGYITKAGYWAWNATNLKITYTENDAKPDTRVDYINSNTGAAVVAEDNVLLNVNGQNHLSLDVNETKTIKAYRAWEIIKYTYQNEIITPDFHFNIISGNDVISLTEKKSPSMGDGDWQTITALKEGIAVIEVTYDAIELLSISNNDCHYPGIYGASDPARTGLVVVTVGGETPDVDFGIKGKASQGSVIYGDKNSVSKAWDAEFDTLYFTGDKGEIKLAPSVTDGTNIDEVAVSNDKGTNWTVLTANEGIYTADIVSGNNIIRVTTGSGVAYQIVRGYKVNVKISEVQESSDGDGIVEAGETVRVYIEGLHQPIPKMAGNYNPGYAGNTDGKSDTHLSYMWNGTRVQGVGSQYNFANENTYIDVTIPADTEETSFTLSDGYIGTGVIGLTTFADDGDSHRNIPDNGCGTRGSATTFHTRSMLPEITITIGGVAAENTAPVIRENAPLQAELEIGKTYALNLGTDVFEDKDGNILTYKVSVNDAEAVNADEYYKFTPDTEGEYKLTFTANDGKVDSEVHTVILTVTKHAPTPPPVVNPEFGLNAEEIVGYVYISFEDNGKRVEGESGVKYPEPLGTIISRTKVPYKEGDTIADVTLRLLEAKNMTASYSGSTKGNFYLSSIGNFTVGGIDYDSFGEFDAGVGSGWMITHNDIFIDQGASQFEVRDGDEIKWKYTCQYGADIGDPYFDSMGGVITPVKNAVDIVEELIDEIGEVTLSSKDAIDEARAAYDALTDSQKNLVENYNDLLNAESRYEALLKAEKLPFTDVEKHWGIEAIMYVYENNIMNGTSDTTFEPDTLLSRGMLITTLYRLAGAPEVTAENPFPDVKADEWYTDAVIWAYENGIVNGYDDGNFGPNDNITREQMAVMLMNYAKFKGIDTSAKNDLSQFADAENTSAWAVEAVKWAVAEGLITGRDTGLMPKAEANRAETATVLMRFMEK